MFGPPILAEALQGVDFYEHPRARPEEMERAKQEYQEMWLSAALCNCSVFGIALTIFLFYFVYHVISKVRGNEKNQKMNNFGLFLSVFGLVYYSA